MIVLTGPATVGEVEVELLDGWVEGDDTFVRVAMSVQTWARVEPHHVFHLDPEHWPRSLHGGGVLRYRLLLRGPRRLGASAEHALRSEPFTESWYAVEVERDLELPDDLVGTLSEGRSTAWAAEPQAPDSSPLLRACERWFASQDVVARRRADATVLHVASSGSSGEWDMWIETDEERRTVGVLSAWGELIPPSRRADVQDLTTRWNLGQLTATAQLDPDSGVVSVRTGVELGGAPWHDDLLAGIVGANAVLFEQILPELAGPLTARGGV